MTLKFMAGIVTSTSEKNNEIVYMFWQAMTCNVDGIIELGVGNKVNLMMHMLS